MSLLLLFNSEIASSSVTWDRDDDAAVTLDDSALTTIVSVRVEENPQ